MWSEAPAIIPVERFAKAPRQLQRHAASARKLSRPTARRYVLRPLVQCGECGVSMVGIRQRSGRKKYADLSYACKGSAPLSVGRTTPCHAKLVRVDRLATLVWDAREPWLHQPSVSPQLQQTWAEAKQHRLAGLEAHQAHLRQRRQRRQRQEQRVLDAYQAEMSNLPERQTRRQKLAAELHQIAQESQH
jgi:hypothetical protein